MEQPIALDVGRRTERGRTQELNEDFLGTPEDMGIDPSYLARKGYLYAVCDGMGGHAAGEAASRLAMQTIFNTYYADPSPNAQESLRQAVARANAAVYAAGQADPAEQRRGSTVVAAILQGDQVTIASVGDSRAYLVSQGGIGQITTDHTWVQEQVAAGVLTPEQARRHTYRSIVSRSLGAEPEVQVDLFQERMAPGEALLLCSDGLSGPVSDRERQNIVLKGPTAQAAANRLVDLAKQRGGDDDITAVVLRASAPAPVAPPGPRIPPLGLLAVLAGLVLIVLLCVASIGALQRILSAIPGPAPTVARPLTQPVATTTPAPPTVTRVLPPSTATRTPAPPSPSPAAPTPIWTTVPTQPPLQPTIAPPTASAWVVPTIGAIMRVEPTTASARVTAVAYRQTVKLLEQNVASQELTIAGYPTSNLWHKVEWGGYTGYIWAPLLQECPVDKRGQCM